jgi:hypothetical protein
VRRHAPVGSLEPRSCTGNLRPPQRTAQSSGLPRLPQLPQYPCRRGARSHGCPRRTHARALCIKARPAHGLLHVHIQLKVGPSTHNECLHFVPFCIRRCHARRSGCGGRCHRGAQRHCQRAAHAGPCARRRDRGRRRWGSATRGRAWSHRSRTARVVACAARQELKRPLKPWVSRFRHDASSNKKGPQSIVSVPEKMLIAAAGIRSFMALLGRLLSGRAEPQHICRGKIVEAGGRLACLATDKLATTEMPARRMRLRRIFWRTLTSELRVALVPPLVRMLTANNSGVRVHGERMLPLLCRRTPRPGSQRQRHESGRRCTRCSSKRRMRRSARV